jgi:DNA-binding IclR family transcriptional regulator
VEAFRAPNSVMDRLRRAAQESGYSHYIGRFVNGRIALTAVAEGSRSPFLEDLVPGFDDGAHAHALGKALLATMRPEDRLRYVKESGMRSYTRATLESPDALESDLSIGERRGMQVELGQFRTGIGCAAVVVLADRDPERRMVVAVAAPLDEMAASTNIFRTKLTELSRDLRDLVAVEPPAHRHP